VLVIDDEPAIRLLCRVNLELEGFRVLEATTLTEARRTVDEERVDAVLLDMRIGMERGDDILDELHGRGLPVIVVTGSAEVDPDWSGKTAAVLGKPFQIDQLLGIVKSLVPR
jgi:DNA-binding response OmpR family regulator